MDPNSMPTLPVNEPPPEHIPGRRRRLLIVLAIALAVGLAAAAGVLLANSGGGGGAATAAGGGCRALSGAPPLALQLPGGVAPQGNQAVSRAAERLLAPGDARIGVARAMLAYPSAGGDATLRALHALDQTQPAVRLYEALTELWAGHCTQAVSALRRLRTSDMYGFYGTIADNTLHAPGQRANYPIYLPPQGTPTGSLAHLQALVRAHPDQGSAWLGLAYAEQRQWLKHRQARYRLAAQAAARRALQADPTGVSPRVAVAVLTYDKDNPAASFSVLGPLVQQASDPTEIRFHLGELLYWLNQDTDAVAQWRQVVDDSPTSIYGRTAAALMSRIS
jgi:hypothetical protein